MYLDALVLPVLNKARFVRQIVNTVEAALVSGVGAQYPPAEPRRCHWSEAVKVREFTLHSTAARHVEEAGIVPRRLTFGQQSLDSSSSLFVLGEIVAPGVVNDNVWHLTDVCQSARQVVNDDSFAEGWSWQAARNNPVWSPRKPRAPPRDHEGWTSDRVQPLRE